MPVAGEAHGVWAGQRILADTWGVTDAISLKRSSRATLSGLLGLTPWALLFGYIVANSTLVGEPTDWGQVVRASLIALVPLVLAVALFGWNANSRSMLRGWPGVLMSWAVAFVVVALWLGPFI